MKSKINWKNKEEVKDYHREYNKEHREKNITRCKKWHKKHLYYNEKYYEKNKEWKENNPEKVKAGNKKYREEHKEYYKRYQKGYYEKNKNKINAQKRRRRKKPDAKEKRNKHRNKRCKEDPTYKLMNNLRCRLSTVLQLYSKTGKIASASKYGINYKKIIEHLKPFPEDIENYEVDHIIPLSWFDFNDKKEIKWAFAPENHQWLLIEKNHIKGNRFMG